MEIEKRTYFEVLDWDEHFGETYAVVCVWN